MQCDFIMCKDCGNRRTVWQTQAIGDFSIFVKAGTRRERL